MIVLDINKTYTADNYPYGGKRTSATFGVEFDKKKGCRNVFTTLNPGTGLWNKPKKSTYTNLVVIVQEDNGHYDWKHFNVNGNEDILKTFNFIADNFVVLNMTSDMHSHIIVNSIISFKYSLPFIKFASPESKNKYVAEHLTPILNKMNELQKSPNPDTYREVVKMIEAINEYRKENCITF